MHPVLAHSMFAEVLFPRDAVQGSLRELDELRLERVMRLTLPPQAALGSFPFVIFDFETTGLDSQIDEIVEIGGLRVDPPPRSGGAGAPAQVFESLVRPAQAMTHTSTLVTKISQEMLQHAPPIAAVLPKFLEFIDGAVLIAHNAEFDAAFLRTAAQRQGTVLDYPILCTLKLARHLLPNLESRSLDHLAQHYGLQFEARHRSIGDAKVTLAVLESMLASRRDRFAVWQDLHEFRVA